MDNFDLRYLFDSQGSRLERANKRLFILVVIITLLFLATNSGWLFYANQFRTETTTQVIEAQQDATEGGNNTIIGGDYGKAESEDNNNDY